MIIPNARIPEEILKQHTKNSLLVSFKTFMEDPLLYIKSLRIFFPKVQSKFDEKVDYCFTPKVQCGRKATHWPHSILRKLAKCTIHAISWNFDFENRR